MTKLTAPSFQKSDIQSLEDRKYSNFYPLFSNIYSLIIIASTAYIFQKIVQRVFDPDKNIILIFGNIHYASC